MRNIEMEVEDMCNLSQGIRDEARAEGLAKGKAEGRAEGVMSLMSNMNISMEKAMNYLNITEDIRLSIMKYIEDKK